MTKFITKQKGLIQGSPESSFLFSELVNSVLLKLDRKWKEQGFGMQFNSWGSCHQAWNDWCAKNPEHADRDLEQIWFWVLAFVDDLYIVAQNLSQAQTMLNDLIEALKDLGLKVKLEKVRWMSDSYELSILNDDYLEVEGTRVKPSESIKFWDL